MKKGCYVPVGRCPTAGLRCRVGRFWTVPTGHQRPPPPLKRWTKLLPAYGAHVRWPLAQTRRSAAVPWRELSRAATHRELPGVQPRELTAQALGKLYVGSPFSCSVNLRGQPTGCPRFFYAAPPAGRRDSNAPKSPGSLPPGLPEKAAPAWLMPTPWPQPLTVNWNSRRWCPR